MPDIPDIDTLTAQAGEAASQGDTAAAAVLLRRVLDLQVSALGPDHHELAPTLNNLAMMLERQGEMAEAERCYRRAYDVARRGAAPDDAMVQMSRSNLIAFLQASGVAEPVLDVPFDERESTVDAGAKTPVREATPAAAQLPKPAPPSASLPRPAPTPTPPKPAGAASTPASSRLPKPGPAPVATPAVSRRGRRFAAAIIGGAVVGGVAGWLLIGSPGGDSAGDTPQSVARPAESAPAPAPSAESTGTPVPAPALPAAPSSPAVSAPTSRPAAPSAAAPARKNEAAEKGASRPAEGASVGVDGRVCSSLTRGGGAWRCDPAGDPTTADAVYYYSRVRSSRDLVVRHRWTHQGQVVRTVIIEVRANPSDGFRTFSRQSLAGRTGLWEVALIAPDGTVAETLRFTSTAK